MSKKQFDGNKIFDERSQSATDLIAAGYGDLEAIQKKFDGRIRIANDGSMRIGRVTLTRIGLPLGTDMDADEYQTVGEILANLQGSIAWMIGDFILYGETEYGKTTAELAEIFGLEVSTVHTYTWLCRHVNFSTRIENLSPKVHRIVAPMPEEKQRYWLGLADENSWSAAELSKQIRQAINPQSPNKRPTWEKSIDKLAGQLTPAKIKRMPAFELQRLRDQLVNLISQIDSAVD